MKPTNSSQKSKESKEDIFNPIKNENYDESFPRAEQWLRTANSNLLNEKKERNYNFMKYFAANKLKLAYTFLILAFVVAACNYPVTQHETIGEVISWDVSAENTDAVSKIDALDLLKNGDYTCDRKGTNGQDIFHYNLVVKDVAPEKIAEFKKRLESIAGVGIITSVPLNETITRPVYSAALNEIFKININAANKSDDELRNEITEQLKKAGVQDMQIDFERDAKGHRMIKFIRPLNDQHGNGGFDVTISDGNTVNHLKELRKTGDKNADRFKGKSDDEIRQMVKEDFKEVNLTDDQIKIQREGDNVKVKVSVSREEGNFEDKFEIEKDEK